MLYVRLNTIGLFTNTLLPLHTVYQYQRNKLKGQTNFDFSTLEGDLSKKKTQEPYI